MYGIKNEETANYKGYAYKLVDSPEKLISRQQERRWLRQCRYRISERAP